MKTGEFIRANLRYLIETEPGSVIDTVRSRQPVIYNGEINADLHTHPCINSKESLLDTLDVMVENNVDLCAITTHGKSNEIEFDFGNVKRLIENERLGYKIGYEDKGLAFEVSRNGKRLTFIPGYEFYVKFDGIEGGMDIISLMPERGFEKEAENGRKFIRDHLKINRDYDAIVIGTHPYTIADAYGPFGFFKFRLANEDERNRIRGDLFPMVDVVDLVATNCAWMTRSNELVQQEYNGKPLANSDAHSKNHYTRKEIGRAGNILRLEEYRSGNELKEQLKGKIKAGEFRTYLNYMPSLQFLMSIALYKPFKDFP